jgi:hypothetical protein
MKSSRKLASCRKPTPGWHADFLAMMPSIKTHARIAFRSLDPEAREEAIQETLCNACCAYARLAELGKTDRAFPSALARFGVAQTRSGRKVGGKLNNRDVSSEYCQRQKDLIVERLDKFDKEDDAWQEVVVEDRRAGPAVVAATRIDFAAWLRGLPRRLQKIARFLASGESTTVAAEKFGVSQGRISQIRKELFIAWHVFQDEEPTFAAA